MPTITIAVREKNGTSYDGTAGRNIKLGLDTKADYGN